MTKDSYCGHFEWNPRAWRIIAFFTVVLASLLHVRGAQQLTFAPPQLDSSGRLLLSLRGEPEIKYVIETSADLTTWVPLFTGITSGSGQLDYSHHRKTNSPGAYYMARSRTDLEKLVVIPQPDTNYATVALITTDGGACSLTNLDGVIYTFTVPPFAVTESVAITMTLLTNVGGFPLTNGFGAAVSFAPEGLEFYAPGLLEIRYPTNIAMLDVDERIVTRALTSAA